MSLINCKACGETHNQDRTCARPPLAGRSGSEGCAWTDLRAYWAECEKLDKDYRTDEERVLLGEMFTRYEALKKLGWQDIIYCPKDGSEFLSISAGSPGVHRCHYDGEWPKGFWWISEAGDMRPAHPILWKPMMRFLNNAGDIS